jgi:hypothetical protein
VPTVPKKEKPMVSDDLTPGRKRELITPLALDRDCIADPSKRIDRDILSEALQALAAEVARLGCQLVGVVDAVAELDMAAWRSTRFLG